MCLMHIAWICLDHSITYHSHAYFSQIVTQYAAKKFAFSAVLVAQLSSRIADIVNTAYYA